MNPWPVSPQLDDTRRQCGVVVVVFFRGSHRNSDFFFNYVCVCEDGFVSGPTKVPYSPHFRCVVYYSSQAPVEQPHMIIIQQPL